MTAQARLDLRGLDNVAGPQSFASPERSDLDAIDAKANRRFAARNRPEAASEDARPGRSFAMLRSRRAHVLAPTRRGVRLRSGTRGGQQIAAVTPLRSHQDRMRESRARTRPPPPRRPN